MSRTDRSDRAALEMSWLDLTRTLLPAVAASRGWPVRVDHCFQRILLDNACQGVWYDCIAGRPAYAHAEPAVLMEAISLAEAALAGDADMHMLNRRSLGWRNQKSLGDTRVAKAFYGGRGKD